MLTILAVGNPGSGKSTVLNSLTGANNFEAGVSFGSGLTSKLKEVVVNGIRYADTPGVADDTYRAEAGLAMAEVFKAGGRIKTLFFITQQAGRVVVQDVATMRIVLDAVPDIGQNYGIIVNKMSTEVLEAMARPDNVIAFKTSLFQGIPDKFKHNNIIFIASNQTLAQGSRAFLTMDELNSDLREFVKFNVPYANIEPGKYTDIPVDQFDRLTKQIEDLQMEIQLSKEAAEEETKRLTAKIQEAEAAKLQQLEESRKEHERSITEMKQKIQQQEQKMRAANVEARKQEHQARLDMMRATQEQNMAMQQQMQQFMMKKNLEMQEGASSGKSGLLRTFGAVGLTAVSVKCPALAPIAMPIATQLLASGTNSGAPAAGAVSQQSVPSNIYPLTPVAGAAAGALLQSVASNTDPRAPVAGAVAGAITQSVASEIHPQARAVAGAVSHSVANNLQ